MALAAPQQDLISKTGSVCKQLLELTNQMTQINELYNGSPNWDVLFTDEEIGAIQSFADAGLTAQIFSDAVYQVSLIRGQILTGNLPAVVLLAQLG